MAPFQTISIGWPELIAVTARPLSVSAEHEFTVGDALHALVQAQRRRRGGWAATRPTS